MGGQWVKMSVLPCLSLIVTIKNQFPESEFESIKSQGFTDTLRKILLNNSFFKNIKKMQMSLYFKKTLNTQKKTLSSIIENPPALCLKLMLRTFFIYNSYLLGENH